MRRGQKRRNGTLIVFILLIGMFLTIGLVLKDKLIRAFLSPRVVFAIAMPATMSVPLSAPTVADASDYDMSDLQEHDPLRLTEIDGEISQFEPDVPESIRLELLEETGEKIDLSGKEPRVLIYHTHTTEAYTMTPGREYVETSKWRTAEHGRNIVAIGETLANELRKNGISVIHDSTNHEPPALSTSYERSLLTMESYLKKYPTITLFIDVHRDAAGSETKDDYVVIDGKRVARMMFVVGTGESKTGAGNVKPDFKANYGLAKQIMEKLQKINAKLMRPIRVKTKGYNQHLPGRSLLVEVGHNMNTFDEAANAMPYLAQAIVEIAE